MSVSEHAQRVGGSAMKLPLRSAGDHNGNAFPISSSSSSSSSSCLGESSPESLRSLSSLSGSCTDSPLDYDVFEVALMRGVVVTKWEEKQSDDDASAGPTLTVMELPESNDNTASVYTDASSGDFQQDTWKHLTLELSMSQSHHGNSDDVCSRQGHGSSTPDSDATEIPADDDDDDDDDEEEALFLSVSSDMSFQRQSATSSVWQGGDGGGVTTEFQNEGPEQPSALDPVVSSVDPPEEDSTPPPKSEDPSESEQISPVSPSHSPAVGCDSTNTSPPANKTKPAHLVPGNKITPATAVRPSTQRVSKVEPKTIKAKVPTWANNQSAPKPQTQNKVPAGVRRPVLRRDEVLGDGGWRQNSTGPIRMVAVLKPLKTKSRNPKTDQRAAQQASTGSEDGPLQASRRAVQSVPDGQGTPDAGEECLDRKEEKPMTQPTSQTTSPSRKVSSKLGPAGRPGLRGASKAAPPPPPPPCPPPPPPPASAPAAPPGSGAGGPGPNPGEGSLSKARSSQGIPKPRSLLKTTANQQPASGAMGRPAPPTASKLPVKGLPTSLSSSSLGSNENNGPTGRAALPAVTKSDERPSRSALPVGSASTMRPLGETAGPRLPAMRSRAQSLQVRPVTGLKIPSGPAHSAARTTATGQTAKTSPTILARPTTQNPLQRSGSARLVRQSSTVDKNKPREAPTRTTGSTTAGGTFPSQQLPAPEPVPDSVSSSSQVVPALQAPPPESTHSAPPANAAPGGVGLKARPGVRSSPKGGSRLLNASRTRAAPEAPVAAKPSKEQVEKKNQAISQLRRLLLQGNRRVEALATVIQHLFTEREATLRQKKELSLQLDHLRDELVTSSQCCERLQKEKEEVRHGLEEALKRLQEQHKEELEQLEDRLRSFYQTEWDKVHQAYQEEADKYRVLMEQQVEEMRSKQEAERRNQEETHSQQMESLKQQHDSSVQELKRIQQTDLENLEKTLKETESSLSEKISELTSEKDELNEKLRAEEERRKILRDKSLKDSHTVYLEQELESLKVVLEMKNNQLHQKEKKLMEMDKLVENNVKLEECLKKVQQENEDYKARMDKHAAISKQLSTEQAILQQTLQKESKVNKRLSMENEELLWKLHNGDLLASPRHLSPTSPFGSPRNSASFPTAAPLSPR
ncbi:unnamed protein product [Ophioblennius macclurei]